MGDIPHGRERIEATAFHQGIHEAEVDRLVLAADVLAVLQVDLHMAHHLLTEVVAQLRITELQYILHRTPFVIDVIQCGFGHRAQLAEIYVVDIGFELILNLLHNDAGATDTFMQPVFHRCPAIGLNLKQLLYPVDKPAHQRPVLRERIHKHPADVGQTCAAYLTCILYLIIQLVHDITIRGKVAPELVQIRPDHLPATAPLIIDESAQPQLVGPHSP